MAFRWHCRQGSIFPLDLVRISTCQWAINGMLIRVGTLIAHVELVFEPNILGDSWLVQLEIVVVLGRCASWASLLEKKLMVSWREANYIKFVHNDVWHASATWSLWFSHTFEQNSVYSARLLLDILPKARKMIVDDILFCTTHYPSSLLRIFRDSQSRKVSGWRSYPAVEVIPLSVERSP